MTQPGDTPTGQLTVVAAVVTGPDGQPWVQLQLAIGLSVHVLLLPEATATELGPAISQRLTEAAGHARRAKLGLVVPGQPGVPQMPVLPPLNGGRAAATPPA